MGAVKSGDKTVDVSTPEKLKATLQRAKGTYFPDPVCANSTQPESAGALIALMATADKAALRLTCGFEA